MKYTIETLKPINQRYCSEHSINQQDLEMVNELSAHIEALRKGEAVPQDGDMLICTLQDGEIYARYAHIEEYTEHILTACVHPYIPFIHQGTKCSASGGPWFRFDPHELEYVGKQLKTFKTWGYLGPCANGAVEFQAEVNVWKIVDVRARFI